MADTTNLTNQPPAASAWTPIVKNFAVPVLWITLGFILAKATTKKGVI